MAPPAERAKREDEVETDEDAKKTTELLKQLEAGSDGADAVMQCVEVCRRLSSAACRPASYILGLVPDIGHFAHAIYEKSLPPALGPQDPLQRDGEAALSTGRSSRRELENRGGDAGIGRTEARGRTPGLRGSCLGNRHTAQFGRFPGGSPTDMIEVWLTG